MMLFILEIAVAIALGLFLFHHFWKTVDVLLTIGMLILVVGSIALLIYGIVTKSLLTMGIAVALMLIGAFISYLGRTFWPQNKPTAAARK